MHGPLSGEGLLQRFPIISIPSYFNQMGSGDYLRSFSQRLYGLPTRRLPLGLSHEVTSGVRDQTYWILMFAHIWVHLLFWSYFLFLYDGFLILSMLRSIPLWHVVILLLRLFVKFYVWQPYARHGKMQVSIIFFFTFIDMLLFTASL